MTVEQVSPSYSALRMRDLPREGLPRERLRQYGANSLRDEELIAILLRTGIKGENVLNLSMRLLSQFQTLPGLGRASFTELCLFNGISDAKACQIMAALELGRRAVYRGLSEGRVTVTSPEDVYNIAASDMVFMEKECLRVILLNTKKEMQYETDVYHGTVDSASVRVAEVIRPAVRENSPSLIVVHNHPSGDPTPSPQDILVTRRIKQAAELLDVELLDHVVIGKGEFVSMKSRQLGF